MTLTSRRLLLFVTAFVGSLGLLAVLLLFFAQPPRPTAPTTIPATPTPKTIAMVDDEVITIDKWQQAVALDQAMSGLVGQESPSPEETLNRLINERLVLRAAEKAGLVQANKDRAEAWLASFLTSWDLDVLRLEQALSGVGLTRNELLNEIIPRLLSVESALAELPPSGEAEAWVADLRSKAKVTLLENFTPLAPDMPLAAASALPAPNTSDPALPLTTAQATDPVVGELAPDFSLEAVDGTMVRLSDERGKPVVLYFWALWCVPCMEELSMLQTVEGEDLVILSIAVREPPDKVRVFASNQAMEMSLLLDPDGRQSDAYGVHGLPTSLFVDRDGVIVARQVGPFDQDALDSILDRVDAPRAPATDP